MFYKSLLTLIAVSVMVAFTPASAQTASDTSNLKISDCFIANVRSEVRCFELTRPISDNSDETVTLKGIIVPSDAVVPEPDPLIVIAGGPGQAATDMVSLVHSVFRQVNNSRDVIFLDIRGTGLSRPISCRGEGEAITPLTHIPLDEITSETKSCYKGIENYLRSISTKTSAEDIDALREALGAEQLNLWGASYGTRLAQYYLWAYPEQTRSAVLDGLVPNYPSYLNLQPLNALAALEKLNQTCADDIDCSRAFPDFDAIALLDQISEGQEISFFHPVTGDIVKTKTSRINVANSIFIALYSPATRMLIPYLLTQAVEHDNWAPLSVLSVDMGKYIGTEIIYMGAHLSITCAEELPAINEPALSDDPFMRNFPRQMLSDFCQNWPAGVSPLPHFDDASLDTPTIMISGTHDPITPPIMADHAAKSFSDVRLFTIQDGGHGNSTIPCMSRFIGAFVKEPNNKELEPNCIADAHVPAFTVSATGPIFRENKP